MEHKIKQLYKPSTIQSYVVMQNSRLKKTVRNFRCSDAVF